MYDQYWDEAVNRRAEEMNNDTGVGLYTAKNLAEVELTKEVLGYILYLIDQQEI